MDFLPTKGVEYLIILAYLAVLAPFWWLLSRLGPRPSPARAARQPASRGAGSPWFALPEGFHFHRGHTWVQPEKDGVMRVGMDDFAQRLLGAPDALLLPAVGTRLSGGDPGWRTQVDGHTVDVLSPLEGVVTEVNPEVQSAPEKICEDPYGSGWLLKVRTEKPRRVLKNLMPYELARDWMAETTQLVSRMAGPELGAVLQDGGRPVSGFVRPLGGERWADLAAELLLTAEPDSSETPPDGPKDSLE
jgi:glycine cleavage system H lipoate-binding protein